MGLEWKCLCEAMAWATEYCDCYLIDLSCWILSGSTWREHAVECEKCRIEINAVFCEEHGRNDIREWRNELEGLNAMYGSVGDNHSVCGTSITQPCHSEHGSLPWVACASSRCEVHGLEWEKRSRARVQRGLAPVPVIQVRDDSQVVSVVEDGQAVTGKMSWSDLMELDGVVVR